MRKALTSALIAAVLAFGTPLAAAGSGNTASLAGRAVDVSGRAVAGQRVELLRGTAVVGVDTTSLSGAWMFTAITPGTYVVRMTLNGKVAGVRVAVRAGEALAGNLIVAPAIAAAPQIGIAAGLLGGASSAVVTAAAAAVATATAAAADTVTLTADPAAIAQVLASLTEEQQNAFAEALIEALEEDPTLESQFAEEGDVQELIEALEEVIETPGADTDVTIPGSESGL